MAKLLAHLQGTLSARLSKLSRAFARKRLLSSIANGDSHHLATLLVQSGWDINESLPSDEDSVSPRAHAGFTLLHEAAKAGHVEVVEALISMGADPHRKTNWHITPMHLAARAKHAVVVSLLEDAGSSVHDRFPSLSRFAEDDPYTPTSIEILASHGICYLGTEYRDFCMERTHAQLGESSPPAPVRRRPRL